METVNAGTGVDSASGNSAALARNTVGYAGEIVFDTAKPDGMLRKPLGVQRLTMLALHAIR